MDKLPDAVKLFRNNIDSVYGDVTTEGASCVKLKTDVTSILEEVQDTDKVVKTHVFGPYAESNNLKDDIHRLKSKTVKLKYGGPKVQFLFSAPIVLFSSPLFLFSATFVLFSSPLFLFSAPLVLFSSPFVLFSAPGHQAEGHS